MLGSLDFSLRGAVIHRQRAVGYICGNILRIGTITGGRKELHVMHSSYTSGRIRH